MAWNSGSEVVCAKENKEENKPKMSSSVDFMGWKIGVQSKIQKIRT